MFLHNLKYATIMMFRNKTAIIWTVLFPIALVSFMFMAFGNIYDKDMAFHTINVAVVTEKENENFEEVLESLQEAEGEEEPLLKVIDANEEEALAMLTADEVKAVIYENDEIGLTLAKADIPQEIVRSVVEQYNKTILVVNEAAQKDPAKIQEVVDLVSTDARQYLTEMATSDAKQDLYINYFYAVLAMSCMFGSFGACDMAQKLATNASDLGGRRSVAKTTKGCQAIAGFLVMWLFQVAVEILTVGYMILIGVDMKDTFTLTIPVLALGAAAGQALGLLAGSLPRISGGIKSGICISVSMTCSVMSDLCASGVKDLIEHKLPVLNRVNPAVLMADSFYALQVFDNYDRYLRNIGILGVIVVAMLTLSYFILRRNSSASV